MKNILVLASSKSGRIRHKHVEFKADKHVVIAGNLCHKANPLKVIGHITRCYSEPDAADTTAPMPSRGSVPGRGSAFFLHPAAGWCIREVPVQNNDQKTHTNIFA